MGRFGENLSKVGILGHGCIFKVRIPLARLGS